VEARGFPARHARVSLRIAQDPGVRLRHIAVSLGITERSAHGIVTIRQMIQRARNRYRRDTRPTIKPLKLPIPGPLSRSPAVEDRWVSAPAQEHDGKHEEHNDDDRSDAEKHGVVPFSNAAASRDGAVEPPARESPRLGEMSGSYWPDG
jgi:hypothetical protein